MTKQRVSIEATGSNQDKPLGMQAVISLRADYSHTSPYAYCTHICPSDVISVFLPVSAVDFPGCCLI